MENEVIKNICVLVKAGYLQKCCRFRIVKLSDNGLRLNKGQKNFDIVYNRGSDLYNIQKHKINRKTFEVKTEHLNGVFFEDVRGMIERFFNMEIYIMENLVIKGC